MPQLDFSVHGLHRVGVVARVAGMPADPKATS
jgi:hypothetical protein